MSDNIVLASESDREQIMKLYKEQLGRKFCAMRRSLTRPLGERLDMEEYAKWN